jgi:Icc-related predicted phosphoesterase
MVLDINSFEKSLQSGLNPTSWNSPKNIVEDVIKASLKAGNVKAVNTDLLVEAAIHNPDVLADIKAVAGRLLNDKL